MQVCGHTGVSTSRSSSVVKKSLLTTSCCSTKRSSYFPTISTRNTKQETSTMVVSRIAKRSPVAVSSAAAAAGGGSQEDVQGEMLEPSLANNPWVRLSSVMAIVALSAKATGTLLSMHALGFVHMMAFGMWFGTLGWTSTVFGIVAFRTLPRQMFGKLQSKLFPKYFTVTGAAPAFMMGTLYYLMQGSVPMHELRVLGVAALTAILNLGIAEPAATRVMFQRYALENAEGARDEDAIRSLKKEFGKWHGISSLLNLVNLVCAVGHAWFLAHCFVA